MNLAYISVAATFPPGSASVHAYQITSRLAKHGLKLAVLDHDPNPEFQKFSADAAGLRAVFDWADAIYARASPKIEAMLLPHLVQFQKPLFWEINAPVEETLWAARLNRRGLLPTRTEWRRSRRAKTDNETRRQFAALATAAFCVSEPLADYARDFCGVRETHVVPNGSEPALFRPTARNRSLFSCDNNDFVIAWAGAADYPWHDLPRVIELARAVETASPHWKFAFFCDRADLPESLPSNVVFSRKIPYFELPSHLASADAGLCLYRGLKFSPCGNYFSPLKLYDYLACGLPVVMSNSGQAAEVTRKYECGIAIGDSVNDLRDALTALATNRERAAAFGRNARRAVEEFYNWERAASKTLDGIRSLAPAAK